MTSYRNALENHFDAGIEFNNNNFEIGVLDSVKTAVSLKIKKKDDRGCYVLGSWISDYICSQELYSRTSDKYLHPNLVCNGSVWDTSFEIPSHAKNNSGFIYYKIARFYGLPLAVSNSRTKHPAVKSIHWISHISSSKRREYLMFVWKFQAILKIISDL